MRKIELKPMIYSDERKEGEILAHDVYCGYEFCIISRGTHPCAYVRIPFDDILYRYEDSILDNIMKCHGGITWDKNYVNGLSKKDKNNDRWLGWAYVCLRDYYSHGNRLIKWRTEEILEEIKEVVDRLKKYKAELN